MMECLANFSSSVGATVHDEPWSPLRLLAIGPFHLAAIIKSFSRMKPF
jgi:hypothetical protein